jgi:hypothetical protein
MSLKEARPLLLPLLETQQMHNFQAVVLGLADPLLAS